MGRSPSPQLFVGADQKQDAVTAPLASVFSRIDSSCELWSAVPVCGILAVTAIEPSTHVSAAPGFASPIVRVSPRWSVVTVDGESPFELTCWIAR